MFCCRGHWKQKQNALSMSRPSETKHKIFSFIYLNFYLAISRLFFITHNKSKTNSLGLICNHKTTAGTITFGTLLALRVDRSSLVVLRLSSFRLEGEEGMLSWASSNMSSWLCLLGSRGRWWLFLSDQFPILRDWLLGFEGSWEVKEGRKKAE